MQRWAAGVEYLGSAYAGWQRQTAAHSLQEQVEIALSQVADHAISVITAGRTDAGVHALQQVIHFDSAAARNPRAWLLGANTHLPHDINLRWVQPVSAGFHARFGAVSRSYRYVICNHPARSALLHDRSAWWPQTLDAPAMHRAAQALVGQHDFSAYRDAQCQAKSAIREMHSLSVLRRGDFIVLDILGNAFLHHMVRNIAGTLIKVGQGREPESWPGEVLTQRNRKLAGITAPAAGLYFIGPQYPAEFGLPPPPIPWFPA